MTHTRVTAPDLFIFAASLAAECVVRWKLRGEQRFPSVRAVKAYLNFQISASILMESTLFVLSQQAYFHLYLAYAIASYEAEVSVVVGLFRDIKGKATAYGSIQAWVVGASFVGLVMAFIGALRVGHGAPHWLAVIQSVRQLGCYIRLAIVLSAAVFGFLMCSSWQRATAAIWGGITIAVSSDFICNELAIQSPKWEPFLRHGPDIAFFVSLFLWYASVAPKRESEVCRTGAHVLPSEDLYPITGGRKR